MDDAKATKSGRMEQSLQVQVGGRLEGLRECPLVGAEPGVFITRCTLPGPLRTSELGAEL